MKSLLLFPVLALSSSAFAASYLCEGINSVTGKQVAATLSEISPDSIQVITAEGNEYTVTRALARPNEDGFRFAPYLNEDYDGQNGKLRVKLPRDWADGTPLYTGSFAAYYYQKGEGLEAKIDTLATCYPTNN